MYRAIALLAAFLGLIGFAIGFLGSFFVREMTLVGRMGSGALVGGTVFLATVILSLVDKGRMERARTRVFIRLADRTDIDNEEFCRAMDFGDDSLLLDIRQALADFYAASPLKIHPDDKMEVYEYNILSLHLGPAVLEQLCQQRRRQLDDFEFTTDPRHSLPEFAREVQRAFARSQPGENYWDDSGSSETE